MVTREEIIGVLNNAIGCATDDETISCLEEAKRCVEYCHTNNVTMDVVLDTYDNLMKCPHCDEVIGCASDWTPNYCCECGNPLSGGNGKG